uniref:Galactosylgalactosylxylosylprotein 3-beta-glucuronosyltransferase n=1 Tax=Drosophila willistoni TaxID=7260 RepID=B4N5C9_DROWI
MKTLYTGIGHSNSSSSSNNSNKMALGKSIKMYLTIFIATTCIYMVLYQYHMSRQPLASNDVVKHQDKTSSSYIASYWWAPMSLLSAVNNNSNNNINNNNDNIMNLTINKTTRTTLEQIQKDNGRSIITVSLAVPTDSRQSTSAAAATTATIATTTTTAAVANVAAVVTTTTTTTKTKTLATTAAATQTKIKLRNGQSYRPINKAGHNPMRPTTISTTTTTTISSSRTTRPTFLAISDPPPLYIITPTYRRPEQLAELTRLGYTLKHVVNLLWLVIEDANKTNPLVAHTLDRIGVPYEYLVAPMPEEYKATKRAKPRGVSNRNRGLDYLRANASEGVLYFADDDNTYDISIFEQMRYIQKVGMWPVGLVTKTGVSSPIIRNGKLDGYYDGWIGGRKYPVDMAGFAVSVKFLHERPHAKMPFKPGYEEDGFLRSLGPLANAEIELLADQCRDILTWHTQTKKNPPASPVNFTRYGQTNLEFIEKLLVRP